MSYPPASPPVQKGPILLDRPLGIGDLLDRAFRVYRMRFLALVGLTALLLLPYALISGLLTGRATVAYLNTLTQAMEDREASITLWVMGDFLVTVLLVALVGLLLDAMVTLSLTHQVGETVHGRLASWKESLRRGLSRLGAFLLMVVLQTVAVALPAVIAMVFLLALIGAMGAGAFASLSALEGDSLWGLLGMGFMLVGLGLLSMALALFLMAFLLARWTVAIPALVLEHRGPLEALRRSWRLTRGHTWRAIGLVVVLAVLGIIVNLPAAFAQGILGTILPPSPTSLTVTTVVNTVLSTVIQILWYPVSVVAYTLFYFDLRMRAESYDLDLEVDRLAAEDPLQGPPGGEVWSP